MLIHNNTFMILREREEEFLEWFRAEIPLLEEASGGVNARLSVMRKAGGQYQIESEAQSVAFQMEFETMDALEAWAAGPMARVVERFEKRFGPEAMTFTSVFETVNPYQQS